MEPKSISLPCPNRKVVENPDGTFYTRPWKKAELEEYCRLVGTFPSEDVEVEK